MSIILLIPTFLICGYPNLTSLFPLFKDSDVHQSTKVGPLREQF